MAAPNRWPYATGRRTDAKRLVGWLQVFVAREFHANARDCLTSD
jgi:hypothetical protein